jgi:hypothetical protein
MFDRERIFTNVAAPVNTVGAALLVANENEGRVELLPREKAGAAVVAATVVFVVPGAARRFASALFAVDEVPRETKVGWVTLLVAAVENEIG